MIYFFLILFDSSLQKKTYKQTKNQQNPLDFVSDEMYNGINGEAQLDDGSLLAVQVGEGRHWYKYPGGMARKKDEGA